MYIWQNEGWPQMSWQDARLARMLAEVHELRGQLTGKLLMLGLHQQTETMVEALTQEIVHSSEIEGQLLNRDSVRSSVARMLGLAYDGLPKEDHYIEGVVQVMLDATQNYADTVDEQRLFGWHAALFPTGYSGAFKIKVAGWREGIEAMQVVSGAFGKLKVHYEAPGSDLVPQMMADLMTWINDDIQNIDPLVKAAVAHLWFVTIHPFDDGNGRLCRTITEMLLSKADKTGKRYYSLSSVILNNRKAYYEHLEAAQKGSLDVTDWVEWFLEALKEAVEVSLSLTDAVVRKTQFWDKHRDTPVNERQRKVLNMLFDGFDGKLNSSKWYKINHCSQDTANRDIKDLIAKGILRITGEGGRSTNYELCE